MLVCCTVQIFRLKVEIIDGNIQIVDIDARQAIDLRRISVQTRIELNPNLAVCRLRQVFLHRGTHLFHAIEARLVKAVEIKFE